MIKAERKNKRIIPDNPEVPAPECTAMPTLGTSTQQTSNLDEKAASNKEEFDSNTRKEWKAGDQEGQTSVYQRLQPKEPLKVDESLIGVRIEYLCSFQTNLERISDRVGALV